MKKILFLNSTLNIGGAEKMFYETVRHLDSSMFTKKVCCLYGPGKIGEALISEGVDLNHSMMKNKYDLRVIYRLSRMIRLEKPDILCIESSPLALFWGFICTKFSRVSCVVTFIHNMRKPGFLARTKTDMIYRLVLPGLQGIGIVSQARIDSMVKEYGLNRAKLFLIQNGIDISKFSGNKNTDGLKKTLGISKSEKIIGMVGRLVHEKAYDVFLRSARIVSSMEPDAKFIIVGDGEKRPYLESLCKKLGISGKVLFLGERDDIPNVISVFDVAVLSSRVESLPLAVLEYMAASKPVVATDVGGISEIITDSGSGILVPAENPGMLAMAVTGLMRNPGLAEKIGLNGRKIVTEKFSVKSQTANMEKIFIELNNRANPCTRENKKVRILMSGPSLEVKGGVSSFAKYYLGGIEGSERFDARYHSTTIDGSIPAKVLFFIKSVTEFLMIMLSDRRIRVVHIGSSSYGSFYRKAVILLISKAFGKKVLFHMHASSFDLFYAGSNALGKWFIRKMLNMTDAIVVLSKTWFSAISGMTDNRNIRIIPHPMPGANINFLTRDRRSLGLNVVTSGCLGRRKGTYDILNIVSSVKQEVPGVCFYLAGDGDIKKIARICREKGIEENVHLLGWLERPELDKLLENADVFLLPSYNEGLPIAILEAMGRGLAVVTTRVGGIPEAVEDGVNGFLINPGDTDEMKRKIVRLLKDKELRDRMGNKGAEKINSTFRLDRVMEKFYREYEALLIQRRRKTAGFCKIAWYCRRLSCMSLQEIMHRFFRATMSNIARITKKGVRLESVMAQEYSKSKFYFESDNFKNMQQEFMRLFPDAGKEIVNNAERLCSHVFKIFYLDWDAGKNIDWHSDIVTGKRWPLDYYLDIDFRNKKGFGEARFVWELNRHQHFLTLAKAYFLTQDEKYAKEILAQMMSWIKDNPAYCGINWVSPLETGLRLISWCWAYKFIENSGFLTEDARKMLLESVFTQAEFVKDNLSLYSSANNHLIGEASALVITGLTFPEFTASRCWVETGKDMLFCEIQRQVYKDGVGKEQAFHYQGFVMSLFGLACSLLKKNSVVVPEESWQRFINMAEFITNIMGANGNAPNVGDSDNGMAIRLSDKKDFNIYKSLLCTASIISSRGDFKAKGNSFGEEHYWIFGMDGFEKYNSIKSVNPGLSSRLFKEGGYCILRSFSNNCKEEILMMDCGELGYPFMAPHGHADLLSITLSADGIDLLIDPGTYLYHTGAAWRDYFRSTRAHNTITINDRNQSELKGPFMWGKRPVASVHECEFSDQKDCITASCDNPGISHKRSIYFYKKETLWTVKDSVTAIGKNIIKQYFHMGQDSMIRELSSNIIEAENRGVFLYMLLDKRFSVEIKKGEIAPILGWNSDIFGKKRESPVLVNTALIENRGEFNTVLYVSREKISLEKAENKLNETAMK